MTERLIIDLAACDRCGHCTVGPSMLALRERATFELVCRRCVEASCVLACPFDALERTEDGIIKRHNMRCVSCKSCALACPFGTIYTELLPFYAMSYEAALAVFVGARSFAGEEGWRERDGVQIPDTHRPQLRGLLQACRCSALEFREVGVDEPDIHIIDEFLAARARRWDRQDRGEVAA
jgi:Fe-S-cluster-containing hydrogenase component 2